MASRCEIEADEAYIGGKAKNMHKSRRERIIHGTGGMDRTAVMGLLERPRGAEHSLVRTHVLEDTTARTMQEIVRRNVQPGTSLYTDQHRSLFTLVDRKTGFTLVGKLDSRTVGDTNRRAIELIRRTDRRVRTITADHGTEFHGYRDTEAATGARFYFATPYHSSERGTSENTNRLLRQRAWHSESEGLRPHRAPAQSSAQKKARLPHTGRKL